MTVTTGITPETPNVVVEDAPPEAVEQERKRPVVTDNTAAISEQRELKTEVTRLGKAVLTTVVEVEPAPTAE